MGAGRLPAWQHAQQMGDKEDREGVRQGALRWVAVGVAGNGLMPRVHAVCPCPRPPPPCTSLILVMQPGRVGRLPVFRLTMVPRPLRTAMLLSVCSVAGPTVPTACASHRT